VAPNAPTHLQPRPIVLVSNRGPVSFELGDDGTPVARRGAGGLVSGLGPLLRDTGARWIAAAMTDGDRVAAARGTQSVEGFDVRLIDVDPEAFDLAYDEVANGALWFVHHGLFDATRTPSYGPGFRLAWDAYRQVNQAFADAVVADAPPDACVLVQDYHLTLLAPAVRAARPDLRLVHFAHTPFGGPDDLSRLPTAVATELLEGLAAHHACGFHCERWATRFTQSCDEVLGVGTAPPTFVAPLATDADDLAATVARPATVDATVELDARFGDRTRIVRVDRIELSKNLLRGFEAYDVLLAEHPEWRERVVFGAFVYPSRQGVPAYARYRAEVEAVIHEINDRWGTDTWTPIHAELDDDYPRSIAALRLADVVLVNPVRDGLNLVAKEAPLVNERDAVVVLSHEAGAWDEVGDATLGVNPFDVAETADALHRALSMSTDDRRQLALRLRQRVTARTPADWLADQRHAADR